MPSVSAPCARAALSPSAMFVILCRAQRSGPAGIQKGETEAHGHELFHEGAVGRRARAGPAAAAHASALPCVFPLCLLLPASTSGHNGLYS